MALETGTYISDLVSTNPVPADDNPRYSADHIKLLKATIKATFPNLTGAATATQTELNLIDGSSAGTIANSKAVIYGASGEVNATTLQVAGVAITSTPAELNVLDGLASGKIIIGNSSNVPTATTPTGDVTITDAGVTAIASGVIVNADIKSDAAIDATKIHDGSVDNTEFGYLSGVTSAIQTQLGTKISITTGAGAGTTLDPARFQTYTTNGGVTITLPTTPVDGDIVVIANVSGTTTIGRNGKTLNAGTANKDLGADEMFIGIYHTNNWQYAILSVP